MTARLTFQRPATRFTLLSIYGLIAAFGLLVARFIPIAKLMQPWWGCPLRRTTGIPCLACGLTRAFDWEAHGHFARAFALTPLGAMAPVVSAIVAAWGIAVLAVRAPQPDVHLDARDWRIIRWALLVSVVGNWVYMVLTRKPT
ncbi:MAG: DUF2752 domain-containing protein [Deltaproteobacteria bacterium]|nr:DUF2752 domain-containing protein [Deltaproteobacteria bacterium]